MKIIKDPTETKIKLNTKSILITRSNTPTNNEFRTLTIKCFNQNNPHKIPDLFPETQYEYTNTEKIRIRRLNVSYYLEGNDIVINDLEEAYIIKEENKIVLKGYQLEVEHRDLK
ncbi:hypothetical protein K9M18_06000 [Candidatus Woesearchaeota archaeon]|nr:hypothetical protein [Candidatus Woesearchaeota archaeon]MCF8014013.1 hypothetical protein [Candidatus Woesearchaeota archaeon]